MRKEYDFSKGVRGAILPSPGQSRVTLILDDEVLAFFRAKAEAEGSASQVLINAALRAAMQAPPGNHLEQRPE
jgi:uncharacterized protein (DUF4415 family)